MSDTVTASDGAQLPLDSLPMTFTYSSTFVATISVFYQGNTYVQTFTNDGTNITFISGWELDPPSPGTDFMVTGGGNRMITPEFSEMTTG